MAGCCRRPAALKKRQTSAIGLYFSQPHPDETVPNKLILLEFNELTPTLMDQFIDEGILPNFARLRDESLVCISEADEDPPFLEPWIQWVTVHTGLPYAEHQVFDLGDGARLNVPRIWDLLGQRGDRVWICGSMNASFQRPINGFILPDPWSTGVAPYPEGEFTDFYDYVRLQVQEHTRASVPVSRSAQLRFLGFMVRHGMSLETVRAIATQLVKERGGENRWKRATILDDLQWDVFRSYWTRHAPDFSTFFLNSTAHFQHMYWRDFEPEVFGGKRGQEHTGQAEAIRFGYRHMDRIVGKCLDMIDDDTTVVLATALGQQPCLSYEDSGGKIFYRITDTARFFTLLGIGACRYAPVMSEQFKLHFASDAEASDAAQRLRSLTLDGEPVMMARANGTEVFAGCQVFRPVPADAMVTSPTTSFRFDEQFYDCNLVKSGMHHPDGIFWVREPGAGARHQAAPVRIPLVDLAPTLLSLCGMDAPAHMPGHPLRTVADRAAIAI